MSINSMIFLTAFLPVVFVLDRLCVRKTVLKNILLLLASLVFYAWGEPIYIVLLLVRLRQITVSDCCLDVSGMKAWRRKPFWRRAFW